MASCAGEMPPTNPAGLDAQQELPRQRNLNSYAGGSHAAFPACEARLLQTVWRLRNALTRYQQFESARRGGEFKNRVPRRNGASAASEDELGLEQRPHLTSPTMHFPAHSAELVPLVVGGQKRPGSPAHMVGVALSAKGSS